MGRFLAGVISALLLMAAGLVLYRGWAADDPPIAPPTPRLAAVQAELALPEEADVPRASPKTREQKRFDRYDKDRDDLITRDEYLASRRKAFAKLDTNGDGRLSFEEWAIRTTTKFATADKDKSRSLNRAEFATTAVKRKAPAPKRCACPPSASEEADE